jgi:hypothetical protein
MESIIMDNAKRSQAQKAAGWDFLIREAKVRLVDATQAEERKSWRRSIRTLELLKRRNVKLPRARRQHSV